MAGVLGGGLMTLASGQRNGAQASIAIKAKDFLEIFAGWL
jgi:hypothetical protein